MYWLSNLSPCPITIDGYDSSDAYSILQEVDTTPVEDSIALNKPRSEIRKPSRYTDVVAYALPVADDNILMNFRETTKSSKSTYWKVAIDDEMQSLQKNKAWDLVKLPKRKKSIG